VLPHRGSDLGGDAAAVLDGSLLEGSGDLRVLGEHDALSVHRPLGYLLSFHAHTVQGSSRKPGYRVVRLCTAVRRMWHRSHNGLTFRGQRSLRPGLTTLAQLMWNPPARPTKEGFVGRLKRIFAALAVVALMGIGIPAAHADAGGGPGSNAGCPGHQPPPPPNHNCGNN
jgi:hypothetical protein